MTSDSGPPDTGPSSTVSVEVETLTAFRDRVNGLLASLDASPAAPGAIASQQLTGAHLGTGFQEVDLLMTRYGVVHQQLQQLSQSLTDQINAMDITLQVSQVGYQNVEAEQIAKLWEIQSQTTTSQPPASQSDWTVDQQLAAAGKHQPPAGGTAPAPTQHPTPAPSPSPSPSPQPTPSTTPTPTGTPSLSVTPSASPSPTASRPS
jgi:hypothetical protein